MFSKLDVTKKNQFLEQTKVAREERAQEKYRDEAATKIQALVRGHLLRKKIGTDKRNDIDSLLETSHGPDEDYRPVFKPALEMYQIVRHFLFVFTEEKDQQVRDLTLLAKCIHNELISL